MAKKDREFEVKEMKRFNPEDDSVKTGETKPIEDPDAYLKSRKAAKVRILITATYGKQELTYLEDDFLLLMNSKNIEDNRKVLDIKLRQINEQKDKLINTWIEEANK